MGIGIAHTFAALNATVTVSETGDLDATRKRLMDSLSRAAESPPEVQDAWRALPPGVAVVVLTSAAAAALVKQQPAGGWPLVVVMD